MASTITQFFVVRSGPGAPRLPDNDNFILAPLSTDPNRVVPLAEDELFNPIQYWHERYYTQTDLARMAL